MDMRADDLFQLLIERVVEEKLRALGINNEAGPPAPQAREALTAPNKGDRT